MHVNFASDITADDEPGDKHWQLTAELILRQGGPTIRQFGCNTRVWQVRQLRPSASARADSRLGGSRRGEE